MRLSCGCGGYIEMFPATDTACWDVRMSYISNLKSKEYNCNFGIAGPDFVGWDGVVGLGNHYGMDGLGFEPQWSPDWDWSLSRLLCKGYRATSPEVKWPGREVYHPSRSGAEVEEWVELHSKPPSPYLRSMLEGNFYLFDTEFVIKKIYILPVYLIKLKSILIKAQCTFTSTDWII